MNDAYLHLSIEELSMDEMFIRWARNPDAFGNGMEEWLLKNPDQQIKIEAARQLIERLHYENIPWNAQRKIHLWDRIDQSVSAQKSKYAHVWRGLAVAATVVIGMLAIWLWPDSHSVTSIETLFAQQIEKTLPDQSKIWLNSRSKISYDSASLLTQKRIVFLEGEAQFQVRKNQGFFQVATTKGKITVLGTRFNVVDTGTVLIVSCYEGKVQVDMNDQSIILIAGQSISWDSESQQLDSMTVKIDGMASWLNKQQVFQSIPLSIVFDKIEQLYNYEIVYDSSIANRLYTGFISTESLQDALKTVCWPLHLKYELDDQKITILEED